LLFWRGQILGDSDNCFVDPLGKRECELICVCHVHIVILNRRLALGCENVMQVSYLRPMQEAPDGFIEGFLHGFEIIRFRA